MSQNHCRAIHVVKWKRICSVRRATDRHQKCFLCGKVFRLYLSKKIAIRIINIGIIVPNQCDCVQPASHAWQLDLFMKLAIKHERVRRQTKFDSSNNNFCSITRFLLQKVGLTVAFKTSQYGVLICKFTSLTNNSFNRVVAQQCDVCDD